MPKTLEQLLADATTGDDVKITLGDYEVTVGQLRATEKVRQAAAQAKADYDRGVAELTVKRQEAERLANDSLALARQAGLINDSGDGTRRASATSNPGDIDWENDPVYGPIGKRLAKLENEQLKTMDAALKKMQETLDVSARFVVDQYYQNRWNTIPANERPKDKTYKDFVKMAADLNIKDQYNLPDPVAAWDRSTAEQRRATEIEEARKKAFEEGKKAAAAASMPRPGSTPTLPHPSNNKTFKNLDEAMDAARKDPEIMRIMQGDTVA